MTVMGDASRDWEALWFPGLVQDACFSPVSTALFAVCCVQRVKCPGEEMARTGYFPQPKCCWFVSQRRALHIPIFLTPSKSSADSISGLIAHNTKDLGPAFGAKATFHSLTFSQSGEKPLLEQFGWAMV